MLKQFSITYTLKAIHPSPPDLLTGDCCLNKAALFDAIALAYFYIYLRNTPVYCHIGNIQGTNIDFS